jgi:hypothetical protein
MPEFLECFSGIGIPVDVFPYTVEELPTMKVGGLMKTALAERIILAKKPS